MDKLTARMSTTFWVAALGLSAAYGVTQETKDTVARSENAVKQTQQTLGNAQSGAMELQSARSHLDQAKQAVQDGEDSQAVRMAHEATLYAELALAKSQSATVGKGASTPIASNDNAARRQRHRRVDLIVSQEPGRVASEL